MTDQASFWVSIAGTVTAMTQSLSGLPLLRQVALEGDARPFTKAPIFTMSGVCACFSMYAIFVVRKVDGFLFCNIFGDLLWLVNLLVMAWYSPRREAAALLLGYSLLIAACVVPTLYAFVWLPPEAAPNRTTLLAIAMQSFNVLGFLSPTSALLQAIKSLDTRRVPLTMSWVNLANSSLWTTYGLMLSDPWIYGSNVAGIVIALVQLLTLAYIRCRLRFQAAEDAHGPKVKTALPADADEPATAPDVKVHPPPGTLTPLKGAGWMARDGSLESAQAAGHLPPDVVFLSVVPPEVDTDALDMSMVQLEMGEEEEEAM